ncbi:MAG: PDZ domain-containing protein [Planctomycetaceae bacterium]|nr:PDZ domain-containing protein [Planctomycetaceae bacterium]
MKRGISMLLSAAVLAAGPAMAQDEKVEEEVIQKSGSATVRINVNSLSKDDGEESTEESVVTGKIVIVGPDGEKQEFDLNDKLPEGFEQLQLPGFNGDNQMSFLFKSDEAAEERFMIGVGCEPASDVLRSHLHLGETGLVVTQVSEKLPAAAAGIGNGDILLAVGDQELSSLDDLITAVKASEGAALKFQVMKKGMKEEVEITPKKTTASVAAMGFPVGLEQILLMDDEDVNLNIDMEDIQNKLQDKQGNFIIRRFGPGIRMRGNVDKGMDIEIDDILDGAVEDIQMIDLNVDGSKELKSELEKLKKRLAAMEKRLKAMKKVSGDK